MQRAVADEDGAGLRLRRALGTRAGVKDKASASCPGNGIHDIHMNQGNAAQFVGDDGVYQDGGLLVHFPISTSGPRSS